MPQSVLQGRVAIVTGGARGLGLAMVQALLRAGGRVVVVDLPGAHDERAALVEWAQSVDHGTRLLAVQGDVRRGDDCAHVVAETMRHFGALHGVVNNAGIGPASINPMFQHDPVPFHQVSEQQWRDAVDVNLTGAFLMARAAMPSLLASGAGGEYFHQLLLDDGGGDDALCGDQGGDRGIEPGVVEGPGRIGGDGECADARRRGGYAHGAPGDAAGPGESDPARGDAGADRLVDVARLGWRVRATVHGEGLGCGAAGG